jgi:ATP-dependent Clp protease ATP-binding subunit ClpC
LTDGHGRTVNFRNTVIIMTSNVGSDALASPAPLGFGGGHGDDEAVRAKIMGRLRETFRPEFLNRVDDIVLFRRLEDDELRVITDLLLGELRARVEKLGVRVHAEPDALRWLAKRGRQPEFGARPLRRAIQREIGNRLSGMLLDGQLQRGDQVRIGLADDQLTFHRATEGA